MIRRVSAAVSWPLIALLYGLAYYGTRSLLWVRALDAGVDHASLATAMSSSLLATGLGVGVAAVLGVLLGPSAVAALGLATIGFACMFPVDSAGMVLATSATMGFGAGLYRPALYAAASRPWGVTDIGAAAAVLVMAYLGLNGAGVVAPMAAARLHQVTPDTVGFAAAFVAFVAAGLAATDAGVQHLAPPRDPAPTSRRATGVAIVVSVFVAATQLSWTLGSGAQWATMQQALQVTPWLDALNPAAVTVVGLLVAIVLAVATAVGARIPLLVPAGLGFAGVGAMVLATAAVAGPTPNLVLVGAVLAVGGAAEVVSQPLAMAAAGRGLHWRASTAVLALPLVAATAGSLLGKALTGVPGVGPASGVGLIVGGIAMAVAAIPLERWLLADEVA